MPVEDLTTLTYDRYPHHPQEDLPNHKSGGFTGDDTDNHDFKIDCRGKSKAVVAVVNLTNQDLTVTLYGMHEADGAPGDSPTFEIEGPGNGSFTVTAADNWNYEVLNDPFPWLCIRCAFEVIPDGAAVAVYVDLQQGG